MVELTLNSFLKWVRIITSVKNFKGQPQTYLVKKQYKYMYLLQ